MFPTKCHQELLWDCSWQAGINFCLSSRASGEPGWSQARQTTWVSSTAFQLPTWPLEHSDGVWTYLFWSYLLPCCVRRRQILPPWTLPTDTALGPTPGIDTNWEKYSTNSSLKHSWSFLLVVHLVCFSLIQSKRVWGRWGFKIIQDQQ